MNVEPFLCEDGNYLRLINITLNQGKKVKAKTTENTYTTVVDENDPSYLIRHRWIRLQKKRKFQDQLKAMDIESREKLQSGGLLYETDNQSFK
jgi:hypothetical protein